MPISKEFLPLFKDFVSKYQHHGATTFYNLSKEHHHDVISKDLSDLLSMINGNQESFHDASIVDYLNEIIISSAKTNPYLLEYWLEFKTQYKIAQQTNNKRPKNTLSIKVGPEGTPSEGMIRDLRNALIATQMALTLGQQTQATELELLKKQLLDLKAEHSELKAQNALLQEQVRNEQLFDAFHPQIVFAQQQLSTFTTLLTNLNKVTTNKPKTTFSIPAIEGIKNANYENQTLLSEMPQLNVTLLENGIIPEPPTAPFNAPFEEKEEKTAGSIPRVRLHPPVNTEVHKPLAKSNFFDELSSKIKEREIKKLQTSNVNLEKKNP